MQLRKYRATQRTGFTLMELLVVVAILVVLAGAAVPIYMKHLDEAKKSMAWNNAKTLESVCEAYMLKNGTYPGNLQELAEGNAETKAYVEPQALNDPWGIEYHYATPGTHGTTGKPDIWSDGEPGKNGAQIGNWLLKPPN